MILVKILESPLYNKEIKPVNLKGNQPVTPADSAEASTEGFQVERTDASTSKVPKHSSFKQIVCSSTLGGSSERLKALCNLGPLIHVLHFPQQHWRPERGILGPRGGGWLRDSWWPPLTNWDCKGQSRHMWQTSGDRGVETRGNQLCMKYLTQNPLEEKPSGKIIWDGTKRVYFIIPYNSSEWGVGGVVGHHKLFHGLDHLLVANLGAVSPQLQSCSSGGNWQSCVLLGQGQRPCKASHKTPCPCQDGWSRAVHVNWGGRFKEHPWTLMSAIFFPY